MSEIENGYQKIIDYVINDLGYNTKADIQNMKESAKRSTKGFLEIIKSKKEIKSLVDTIIAKKFKSNYMGMVTIQNTIVTSFCPHHLLPVIYRVSMAYLPNQDKKGGVMGLSKPSRLAEILAARPVLQETFTQDLADTLCHNEAVNPEFNGINSSGSGVVVEGIHMCMAIRGIKQHEARAITCVLHGAFLKKEVREEFMGWVRSNRPTSIV